jgi:hypothetical protein
MCHVECTSETHDDLVTSLCLILMVPILREL